MADENAAAKAGGAETKPGMSPMMMAVAASVVTGALILGGGGYFLKKQMSELKASLAPGALALSGTAKAGESEEAALLYQVLDEFVVNLANPGANRYLKTGITLGYSATDEPKGKGGEESGKAAPFKDKEPILRDAIIAVLTSKTTADLATLAGKEAFKQEILKAAQEANPKAKYKAVYLTSFTMQ